MKNQIISKFSLAVLGTTLFLLGCGNNNHKDYTARAKQIIADPELFGPGGKNMLETLLQLEKGLGSDGPTCLTGVGGFRIERVINKYGKAQTIEPDTGILIYWYGDIGFGTRDEIICDVRIWSKRLSK